MDFRYVVRLWTIEDPHVTDIRSKLAVGREKNLKLVTTYRFKWGFNSGLT